MAQQNTITTAPSGPVLDDGAYDGHAPFPDVDTDRSSGQATTRVAITLLLVAGPFVALALAAWFSWGDALSVRDVLLAVAFYLVTGLGITLGFHRGATHRAFRPTRPLNVVLVTAGSMAFQGPVVEWVATHRRHHAFTDRPGDPHSPYRYGAGAWAQLRGLLHAHAGWFMCDEPTSAERYAPDLLRDPAMTRLNRAFPLLCVASLAAPFLLGWALTLELSGGLTALLWAGVARVALLQHVTWSVNSICHVVGERPYATRRFDRATDFWPLAVISLGESWHNGHHAAPSCARHGRGRHQLDLSALAIRGLERVGWVGRVHWSPEAS